MQSNRFILTLILILLIGLVCFSIPVLAAGQAPVWQSAISKPAQPSLKHTADYQHALFQYFLDNSLRGKGKKTFDKVSKHVKNNITWQNSKGGNAYNAAYQRAFPFVKNHDLQGMPDIVLLIPYLESQWHGKRGDPAGDYGYWQMVPEVVAEIRTLDHAPAAIKKASPNKIRANATLSTQAAQLHLRRYYFYFAKVAGYPETDAWLLAISSYNWGAGNVKRLLASLESKGIKANYSNFYHALYKLQQATPNDISLRAAVEYVPNLWNIAQLLKVAN